MPDNQKLINLAKNSTNPNAVLIELFKDLSAKVSELEKKVNEVKPEMEIEEKVERVAMKLASKLAVLEKGDKGDTGDTPSEELLVELIKPLIPEPIKGDKGDKPIAGVDYPLPKDGKDGTKGDKGDNGKDGSPDTPEQVRDKLESLTGDERLDVSAIKGLKEQIKAIPERPTTTIFGPGKTKLITIDLSSQLNGVLKTFFLGTHYGIVGVWGSSAPFIFRPTTDYNESGKNIVFTNAVDASISLATDQTLIVQVLR